MDRFYSADVMFPKSSDNNIFKSLFLLSNMEINCQARTLN